MSNSQVYRDYIKVNLVEVLFHVNEYLKGNNVRDIKPILERIGRGGKLPHWYHLLENGASMPNLDGKTIGSVIEMVLLAVLEKHTLKDFNINGLEINPAKGVDIPFLDLGVKSPSENFCTSEPFFSSYERLLGNESDALILLTDYQTAKKNPPPVKIQIIKIAYLTGSQIADRNLCQIAKKFREKLYDYNESSCKKLVQFLCHLNQQDWRAKSLMKLVEKLFDSDVEIDKYVIEIEKDFKLKNIAKQKKQEDMLSDFEIKPFLHIKKSNMKIDAIINACNDWVVEYHKDFARLPNDNEWQRFLKSPLDGKIGMSFALQWRFNFGNLFSDLS